MASKKEHKRKQKNKTARKGDEDNPFLLSGAEINSLDLLSELYAVPKATEGGGKRHDEAAAPKTPPVNESADGKAEQLRREEEQAKQRAEEEAAAVRARAEAEEKERRRREAEEARRAEEEAAAARARAEAEEKERRRREAEEARRVEEEAAAARARTEAEEKERRRREAEEARRVEEEAAAARARAEAEEKERRRREAEEARRAEEEAAAARARAEAEEKERRRREAEEAHRAEEEAAAARAHAEALEAERRRQEQLAAERARKLEEEAERARRMTERTAKAKAEAAERARDSARDEVARQEALAAERARQLAVEAAALRDSLSDRASGAFAGSDALGRGDSPLPPAPPIEVENPFWQKPPEIFDVLSGAPHGAQTPAYVVNAGAESSLPVTMAAENREGRLFAPPGSYVDDSPDGVERAGAAASYAVPLEKRMYIVMITSEVAPAAKVGGLGDVILGLGRELMKRGHGVEVICPMYTGMRFDLIDGLHEEYAELWCPHHNEWRPEKVFQGKVGGDLQVNFITGGDYFDRPNIYGYEDDLQRFTYFSRAALEFMYKTNRRPEIIHCHDWATGLVPATLWDIYEKLGWNNSRVVYTIHNNECQGLCGFGDKLLGLIGLDVKNYMRPDRMQDDTHKNCINMMKAGIVYSNFVTTVSPTYAGELKSAAGGRGLQTTIAKNSAKVGGVLNGIDYEVWNPATDDKLSARYSGGDDFFEKYKNKTALREWLGLWDAWRPIISVVTRLTHQKGLDLIKHAIHSARDLQAQFVLLGSAPDPKINDDFLRLQYELKDNHDINLYIGYHEDLSHLIYAGSDMFLVPSLYEPCGLTQMIALRYGTVPIVRETGGLVDTVFDLDNSGLGLNEANGFTFRDPTAISLDYGLERAVRLWYDNPEAFNRLARNGMRYDYSWRHPTEHYENIYNYIKA